MPFFLLVGGLAHGVGPRGVGSHSLADPAHWLFVLRHARLSQQGCARVSNQEENRMALSQGRPSQVKKYKQVMLQRAKGFEDVAALLDEKQVWTLCVVRTEPMRVRLIPLSEIALMHTIRSSSTIPDLQIHPQIQVDK
mmetsp:Transcript_93510/g.171312  ORF Transcript_93510/g.171312 Transcript_93510/m.171312 type:complete len:138 (-) Transcript_93510:2-415(-)